jgi:Icc-related predicted phosphoesterase
MAPVVYAVSDLHGNLPEAPECDLLILGGDICPDFRPFALRGADQRALGRGGIDKGGLQQGRWLDTEFREWLLAVRKRGTEVVAIWGNHDFVGEHAFLVPDLPWTLLQDSETRAAGLRVWGTPWVPGLPYWAFYGREEALQARADRIPTGIDILVTHGPPHRAGDYIPTSEKQRNKYGNWGGMNVGDPTLNDAIVRANPAAVVCGHIHEARGLHGLPLSGHQVYNVAAVDQLYDLYDDPFRQINVA